MQYLSTNFTLEEMTHSQTASRLGITNDPDSVAIEALKKTCYGLEEVRKLLGGKPIKVTSGFRNSALNAACHGAVGSQHLLGKAADFTCQEYGPPSAIVRAILASEILYDQVIWEFGDKGWVHISFSESPRLSCLTVDSMGTRQFA